MKEKLKEKKALEEAAETKPEAPEMANGEQSEEQQTSEEVQTTPSSEEKVNGQLSTTANGESPTLNGNYSASDTDEEGGATKNGDQSKLTNGEVHSTAADNQSEESEPKVNGVSGSHNEEDGTNDGGLTVVSKSGSKLGVSMVNDTQSEATMINGGDSINSMTNGKADPAPQDAK